MKSNLNLLDIFDDIANEIRARNGTTEPIAPVDMRDQIHAINSWTDESEAELKRIGYSLDDRNLVIDNEIQKLNQEVENNKQVADKILAEWDPNTTQGPNTDGSWFLNAPFSKFYIKYFPKINISHLLNACYFLAQCFSLITIPLLDTSNVIDMSWMFYNCNYLTTIPQLDTSKVINMNQMFYSCTSLVSIPQLDTSNVTNMGYMFAGCYSLASIPQLDTSNVTNMEGMFQYCTSLITIPQLDTGRVTDMSSMFSRCSLLTEIHMININTDLSLCWIEYDYSAGYPPKNITHNCPLEHDALVELIGNLMPQENPGTSSKTLTLGETLKAKLSAEEIQVATDKGWTIA